MYVEKTESGSSIKWGCSDDVVEHAVAEGLFGLYILNEKSTGIDALMPGSLSR